MSLWETGEIITKDKLNLKTLYIGSSAPPNPVNGMVWVDVSTTPHLIKIYRDGSWDVARGAPTDRVTAPPLPEASDYQTPTAASASSSAPTLLQEIGNTGRVIHSGGATRVGQRVYAAYIGEWLRRVDFILYKYGSPTGTAYIRVRRVDNDQIVAELASINVTTLPTTPTWFSFTGFWSLPSSVDLRFLVEYSGGDANNYIATRQYNVDAVAWGCATRYDTAWTDETNVDAATRIYFTDAVCAIDDIVDSFWQPEPPNEEGAWIRFDLGSVLAGVAGCRIYWPSDANYRPQAYKIQASVDGSTWDDVVVENTQPPAGWVEYSWIARAQTRYLRILILQHGSSGTRVNEFDYYQSSIWRHGHRGD